MDAGGSVILDGSGMSVVPNWRNLKANRIPKRLEHLFPGAAGSNKGSCFTLGVGPFRREGIAVGLVLVPDQQPNPVVHGTIAPEQAVTITQYQADLAKTRSAWRIDET